MAFLGLCLEPGAGQSPQKRNLCPALGDQPQKVGLHGQQPLVQVPGPVSAGVAAPWTPSSSASWHRGGPRKEGALSPWDSNNI